MDQGTMQGKTCECKCYGHSMKGIFVILFGLAFLLQQLNVLPASFVQTFWPVLLIVWGLKMMMGKMCKCCPDGGK